MKVLYSGLRLRGLPSVFTVGIWSAVAFLSFVFPLLSQAQPSSQPTSKASVSSSWSESEKKTSQDSQFPAVGFHGYGIEYWSQPHFANAIFQEGRGWRDTKTKQLITRNTHPEQISASGYPLFLSPGQVLQIWPGQNSGYWLRPEAWPVINKQYHGRVKLTWKGSADIRVHARQLGGTSQGMVSDGTRVYHLGENPNGARITIHAIDSRNPISEIKLWLPDPADPDNTTLEGALWHPYLTDMLDDSDWGFFRFMDEVKTNGSPVKNWSDRRLPTDAFMTGVIRNRDPETGVEIPASTPLHRGTGMAYEFMVMLCNEFNLDMWLNLPHLIVESDDNFAANLANLIKYGSDGVNPYNKETDDPVYPPLKPELNVYLEYSNEIWSRGNSFPQGDYARRRAKESNKTREQWIAAAFSDLWRTFELILGDNRIIRVGSIQAGNQYYTERLFEAFYTNSQLLPPEIISPTTYWGQGIQNWVFDQGWVQDKEYNNPYWKSGTFRKNMDTALDKLTYFVENDKAYRKAPTGYDEVSSKGGFPEYVRDIAMKHSLPIVAYEGGPSIYTSHLDRGPTQDDGITIFMEQMNREKKFAEIYCLVIENARSSGLDSHMMFNALTRWGKSGQWGHKEHGGQDNNIAYKYAQMLSLNNSGKCIRSKTQ